MGYWLKKFVDGSEIRGTDQAVAIRAASWSKSPLENMIGAELEHHSYTLQINGLGDYWQSDTYEAVFPGPGSVLLQRRIQKKIVPSDTHFRYSIGAGLARIDFNTGLTEGGMFMPIKPAWHGQWLILEYNLKTRKARYYIRGGRV